MIAKSIEHLLWPMACLTLLTTGTAQMLGQNEAPMPQRAATAVAPTVAPQTPAQLDALVAPIALYPDALIAQITIRNGNGAGARAGGWIGKKCTRTTSLKPAKPSTAVSQFSQE